MPSIAPSKSITTTRVARVPYLNSAPYFRGLPLGDPSTRPDGLAQDSALPAHSRGGLHRYELVDCVPRQLGLKAASGEISAGLLPLADYFRLADTFERLDRFGIAVRGRAHSVLLFSRLPIRQLDGAIISVTEETSTTAVLLRLLLEQRYHVTPKTYHRGPHPEGDALLLIGDEALKFKQMNTMYPFEIDLAFEWWLWQHTPFVFAVWAARKDMAAPEKKHLELSLIKALAMNMPRLEAIAQEASASLGLPAAELQAYLGNFIYRLSQPEEEGIVRFKSLVDQYGLLEGG